MFWNPYGALGEMIFRKNNLNTSPNGINTLDRTPSLSLLFFTANSSSKKKE